MKTKIKYVTAFLALIALAFSSMTVSAQTQKAKKVLIVVTSFETVSADIKTGLWLEEFAAPYFYLIAHGVQVTVASPKGGKTPIDPASVSEQLITPAAKKALNDPEAQRWLNNTLKLNTVKAKDYDAVFYPGGHGPTWDMPDNAASIALIQSFVEQQKPTAFVCHSAAALKNVKTKNGEYLIKGKTVTGYSNEEESAGKTGEKGAFSLEDMLRERGANYQKATEKWTPFAVQDGLLITGENPASSEATAEKLLAALNSK
ncbi:type 1 glutamine amidotransferase domain-containing protein [Chitinophaga filiformis]|uniref:type 1 glutamine amidotransferase domain-containing protein n=1 Tax=Chitinophaga filiformis TaxID=104663 RepID=UPI001F32E50D|nr:type 1 glutamine amidotransferase domain-containing protein [Chitinophaga filiformis]MCF6402508.1 type 1 glutamine amidotransferase domain-containing protein [Chitinophaga filiformis]